MNKVKLFFRVEVGASEETADISKIRDKNVPKTNQVLGKVVKFKVNTVNLSKFMTFFI